MNAQARSKSKSPTLYIKSQQELFSLSTSQLQNWNEISYCSRFANMSCNNVKSDTAYSSLRCSHCCLLQFDFDANRQALFFLCHRRNAFGRNETWKRDLCVWLLGCCSAFLFGEIFHRQRWQVERWNWVTKIADNFYSSFLERKHLFWRNRKKPEISSFLFLQLWWLLASIA